MFNFLFKSTCAVSLSNLAFVWLDLNLDNVTQLTHASAAAGFLTLGAVVGMNIMRKKGYAA